MAEKALPEIAVADEQEHPPAVKSADSQALPVSTSSETVVSHEDKLQPKIPFSSKLDNLANIFSETFSASLVNLRLLLFRALPSPLQDRFSQFEEKLRQEGDRFFNASAVNTFFHYLDLLVNTSGLVVRRLQRVVELDTDCLTSCPYLRHYTSCPLIGKSPPCASSSDDNVEELIVKESSAELFTQKETEPDDSTSKADEIPPESVIQGVDVSELNATRKFVPRSSLDTIFNFAFTWLVLYPVNAVVALLNFLRSLTHDFYDYRRLPSSQVTSAGRRIVSPRKNISSRLLTRTMTMLNEVVNLTAGEHAMPFKLSLDPQMSTLRAVPVYGTRNTNIKRKFYLTDDSLFFNEDLDEDYKPVTSPDTSSTDFEDSMTVSENDLSPHEEDGFLSLKEKPTPLMEANKSGTSNPPATFKSETLES